MSVKLCSPDCPRPIHLLSFYLFLSHTHTHTHRVVVPGLARQKPNYRAGKPQVQKKTSSQSVIMLPLGHFILLCEECFLWLSLFYFACLPAFRPLSPPLYFQLQEEFGLEVDQSNPDLLQSPGSHSYKQVMSWMCWMSVSYKHAVSFPSVCAST